MTPRSAAVLPMLLLSACAAHDPNEFDPEVPRGGGEISPETIEEMLDCPADRTPTCVERMGQPARCFCADRDALRRALEPDKVP